LRRHPGDGASFQGDRVRYHARENRRPLRRQAYDDLAAVGGRARAAHEAHLHETGDHAREGGNVDAGPGGDVDLTLPAVVGEHGEDAPHRDAQSVTGERVLPEVDHQQPADAVDEVGKVVAEIEAGTVGHEIEIPADSSRDAFMGRLARCQRPFGATQLCRIIGEPAGVVKLHLQQLQMHL